MSIGYFINQVCSEFALRNSKPSCGFSFSAIKPQSLSLKLAASRIFIVVVDGVGVVMGLA